MQYPLVVCGDVSVDPGVSGPPALTPAPDAPADHATQLASTHQGASRAGASMKTRLIMHMMSKSGMTTNRVTMSGRTTSKMKKYRTTGVTKSKMITCDRVNARQMDRQHCNLLVPVGSIKSDQTNDQ